jgi:hypothetical protein
MSKAPLVRRWRSSKETEDEKEGVVEGKEKGVKCSFYKKCRIAGLWIITEYDVQNLGLFGRCMPVALSMPQHHVGSSG